MSTLLTSTPTSDALLAFLSAPRVVHSDPLRPANSPVEYGGPCTPERASRVAVSDLAFDPLWAAALQADAEATARSQAGAPGASSHSLAQAWQELVRGRVTILCESVGVARAHLLACLDSAPPGRDRAVSPADAALVANLLSGQSQKAVAYELGIAPSTASRRYLKALRTLGLPSRAVPLPLVLAAQTHAGVAQVPSARSVAFEHQGWACLLLSIPRPRAPERAGLTFAEREAAHLLIECSSAREIARRRSTSVPTAMRQVHAVFSKMGVTGRHALIRRAVERDWFR